MFIELPTDADSYPQLVNWDNVKCISQDRDGELVVWFVGDQEPTFYKVEYKSVLQLLCRYFTVIREIK